MPIHFHYYLNLFIPPLSLPLDYKEHITTIYSNEVALRLSRMNFPVFIVRCYSCEGEIMSRYFFAAARRMLHKASNAGEQFVSSFCSYSSRLISYDDIQVAVVRVRGAQEILARGVGRSSTDLFGACCNSFWLRLWMWRCALPLHLPDDSQVYEWKIEVVSAAAAIYQTDDICVAKFLQMPSSAPLSNVLFCFVLAFFWILKSNIWLNYEAFGFFTQF